jgi:hypothetical protein
MSAYSKRESSMGQDGPYAYNTDVYAQTTYSKYERQIKLVGRLAQTHREKRNDSYIAVKSVKSSRNIKLTTPLTSMTAAPMQQHK